MAKQNTENHTRLRQIRVPDDEWLPFGASVGDRERTHVLREFIRWHLRKPGAKLPSRADAEQEEQPK